MTEPQVWTLIGVFAAAMLGGLSLVVTLITRTTGAQIATVGSQLSGDIRALDNRLSGDIRALDSRLSARFDTVDVRFEVLDKEVAGLAKRMWGSHDG